MKQYSFRQWLEYADFGFDPKRKPKVVQVDNEKPLRPLNIEYVVEDLVKQPLGIKEATQLYFGDVRWGEGPGAVRLTFHPYRGTCVSIRKLATDLQGEGRWVCKKVLEVGNYYDNKHEGNLSFKLWDLLKEVDVTGIEHPTADYDGLENLALQIASAIRKYTTQQIFIYDGIKRIEENKHYIVKFNCTGYGVQRQEPEKTGSVSN